MEKKSIFIKRESDDAVICGGRLRISFSSRGAVLEDYIYTIVDGGFCLHNFWSYCVILYRAWFVANIVC